MGKKLKQKTKESSYTDSNLNLGVKGKVSIIVTVVISFFTFYLLTVYIVNKDSKTDDNKNITQSEEKTISYDKILLGRSFSMENEEYYVLYYDSSDEDISSIYNELLSNYRAKDDGLSIYYVDMNDGLNKSHSTTEESNKNPNTVEDLFINGPTLIKVQEGKVIKYIEGESEIRAILE